MDDLTPEQYIEAATVIERVEKESEMAIPWGKIWGIIILGLFGGPIGWIILVIFWKDL